MTNDSQVYKMKTPDFPGYDQYLNGVYRKSLEEKLDEVIVLVRAYVPTKEDLFEHLFSEAQKVEVTPDFDEDIVRKLEFEDKHTQAVLYALPTRVLIDLQNKDEECMDFLDKYLPDPRADHEGHEWYIELVCGNMHPMTHYQTAAGYVTNFLDLEHPYGLRWFTKLMLEENLLTTDVDSTELITRGLFNLRDITEKLGYVFSHYNNPERVLALQDVSDRTIQMPATQPLKKLLFLAAQQFEEYMMSQELDESIN